MIKRFKENEMRNSGVIYNSTLEQIKQLYDKSPEQAGELAISAIELVLTGEISSDDYMIRVFLEPTKKINEKNQSKYDAKKETARMLKIQEKGYDKIAALVRAGCKQSDIARELGITQQGVSRRLQQIRQNYPELLQEEGPKTEEKIIRLEENGTWKF